ncbi:hypothetical protein JNUCC31_08535 [Paenibacillus sp. JNUCC31]|uniref:hypothetical protein n=1 Tax=Paenibacillus sp. JNUCC-31 TaxID=2777983 RepID=UPI00177B76DB|nr:hypothetical protein [Paenibacillus sp. JNUCC-31]QOS80899.1 hypothetical protein JNUCC31_08535 [Paenibacillus sp. JNUCC-31]
MGLFWAGIAATAIGRRSVTQAAASHEKNKNDLTTASNKIIVIVVNRNNYN